MSSSDSSDSSFFSSFFSSSLAVMQTENKFTTNESQCLNQTRVEASEGEREVTWCVSTCRSSSSSTSSGRSGSTTGSNVTDQTADVHAGQSLSTGSDIRPHANTLKAQNQDALQHECSSFPNKRKCFHRGLGNTRTLAKRPGQKGSMDTPAALIRAISLSSCKNNQKRIKTSVHHCLWMLS